MNTFEVTKLNFYATNPFGSEVFVLKRSIKNEVPCFQMESSQNSSASDSLMRLAFNYRDNRIMEATIQCLEIINVVR